MGSFSIRFFVPGLPIAQPRSSFRRFRRGVMAYVPNDHPVHDYQDRVRRAAQVVMTGLERVSGSVSVGLAFLLPPIKSAPAELSWLAVKPDLDNFVKAFCDALKGVVWMDDNQVVQSDCLKARGMRQDGLYGVWCGIIGSGPVQQELAIWKRSWGFPEPVSDR